MADLYSSDFNAEVPGTPLTQWGRYNFQGLQVEVDGSKWGQDGSHCVTCFDDAIYIGREGNQGVPPYPTSVIFPSETMSEGSIRCYCAFGLGMPEEAPPIEFYSFYIRDEANSWNSTEPPFPVELHFFGPLMYFVGDGSFLLRTFPDPTGPLVYLRTAPGLFPRDGSWFRFQMNWTIGATITFTFYVENVLVATLSGDGSLYVASQWNQLIYYSWASWATPGREYLTAIDNVVVTDSATFVTVPAAPTAPPLVINGSPWTGTCYGPPAASFIESATFDCEKARLTITGAFVVSSMVSAVVGPSGAVTFNVLSQSLTAIVLDTLSPVFEAGSWSITVVNPGLQTLVVVLPECCECCVATKLTVLNGALAKLGISQAVASLAEASREAYLGGIAYDAALKEVLRHHPWPFATKYADTADATMAGDPMELVGGTATVPVNGDWQYSYRYPTDAVFARRIVPPTGRVYSGAPIEFRVGRTTEFGPDDDYLLLFTDQADACLEYTSLVACREDFSDALFENALEWRVAEKLAPALSRDPKMTDKAIAMYLHAIDTASAVAQREGQQHKAGEADWMSNR